MSQNKKLLVRNLLMKGAREREIIECRFRDGKDNHDDEIPSRVFHVNDQFLKEVFI